MLQKRSKIAVQNFRLKTKREQKIGMALLYLISILVASGILISFTEHIGRITIFKIRSGEDDSSRRSSEMDRSFIFQYR